MSWLKFINVFILQWFFVRLTKCSETITHVIPYPNTVSDKNVNFELKICFSDNILVESENRWYALQGFVLPLSGWFNNFKFISSPFLINLTNKKEYPIIKTLHES